VPSLREVVSLVNEICRCSLCLALLELAASAERNLQKAKRERILTVVGGTRRRRKAA
jgi:hypothetical protein